MAKRGACRLFRSFGGEEKQGTSAESAALNSDFEPASGAHFSINHARQVRFIFVDERQPCASDCRLNSEICPFARHRRPASYFLVRRVPDLAVAAGRSGK
jgi:hypothetical protein